MVEYIYFVKCPNCEDEHFDFFEEAKAFALGCLGDKPVITQVEVCRNDFGECTDSIDHGIQWSWEDEAGVSEDDPAVNVLTKDDFAKYNSDNDPEFDALDNSVDYEPTLNTDDTAFHSEDSLDQVPDNFRKPIPEGMTIEQLVEEMEENEDTVECAICNELFPKTDCIYDEEEGYICPQCEEKTEKCSFCGFRYDPSELRLEVGNGGPDEGLGWLCSRCEAAIKSRGETLTFRENNYWDFLDESASGADISLEEALEKMQLEYPEYNYGECDECFEVYPDIEVF